MGFIKLNKKAFFHNADYYCRIIGDNKKLCIALKDNAYGHGIEYIAFMSQEYGIKHCIVRTIHEANLIFKYNFETILILYDIALHNNYPQNYIFGINSLDALLNTAKNTKIELKLDTGMSRNGISVDEIDKAVNIIHTNNLNLNGVFTHFCCADKSNDSWKVQERKFLKYTNNIKKQISYKFRVHCANSSGAHKVDNSKYDLARIGIGMYGYCNLANGELKPVLSLFANKISTRTLNVGDKIGYGATFRIEQKNAKVSNYDVGYGDGFFRLNEIKKAKVKNGKEILGLVSMDSFSLSGEEDVICVFDDATHLAKVHDTVEYEILTHLFPNIKREIS